VLEVLKAANLALAFVLELCALAALAYWGFHTGTSTISRTVLGFGAPLLAAAVWGLFVAPQATYNVSDAARLALTLLVFGAAAVALFAAGRPTLAVLLLVVFAINRILQHVWGQ
jgi:hypothetical protein